MARDSVSTLRRKGHAPAIGAMRASVLVRYAIAIASAAVAIAIRLTLDPVWGLRLPYITLFPAVMLSAWFGGLWPGIVTTLVCAVAADYFWIEPGRSLAMSNAGDLLGLFVFIAVGVLISDAERSVAPRSGRGRRCRGTACRKRGSQGRYSGRGARLHHHDGPRGPRGRLQFFGRANVRLPAG